MPLLRHYTSGRLRKVRVASKYLNSFPKSGRTRRPDELHMKWDLQGDQVSFSVEMCRPVSDFSYIHHRNGSFVRVH